MEILSRFSLESCWLEDAVEMVLHNPNNWHWVNKDVSAWARQYVEDRVTKLSASDNGVSAKVGKVISMDGDVDVSQRKGKVITLFDVKLQLEYTGAIHLSHISLHSVADHHTRYYCG